MSGKDPVRLRTGDRWQSRSIAEELRPKRGSLTVNCLVPIERAGRVAVVCHNFDPKNWNQWYPPFTFYHCEVPSELTTEGELISYFESRSPVATVATDRNKLRQELGDAVKVLFGLERAAVSETELAEREYWLKFSETRKVWTLYCFVWCVLETAEPRAKLGEERSAVIGQVPLGATSYHGLAVVENLCALWQNKPAVERLRARTLSMDGAQP
jgi:hypothetical protein